MIGRRLAHYQVTAAIGAGGMGQVYRATDTRLHREVALKILPPESAADPVSRERFQREARAVAALNHPHVVTIYSVEEADGVHFLTMELLEGDSLAGLIPAGGMAIPRLLEIAVGLADALAAAHEAGVVHRDLKPANAMLTKSGRLKVLDFGLAQLNAPLTAPASAAETPTEMRTREGVVMGTVPYMSPEQLQGRAVDHRSDLYSLGVLIYEMACGERPFRGSSAADLASAILRDAPPPLGGRRPDLPASLTAAVMRCLQKRPDDRYSTAREVMSALAGPASDTPNVSSPAPPGQVSIAVLPFSDMSAAKDQQYFCEGMAEEIMNALVRTPGLRVASRTSTFRVARDGDDLGAIARALSVSHVLEGSVRAMGARLRITAQLTDAGSGYQLWSERYDREALDVFAIQDEIAAGVVLAVKTRLAPGTPAIPARSTVHDVDAYRCYLKARHLRGKEDFAGAMGAFEEAVRRDPAHAPSWTGLAEITVLSGHMGVIPARAACTAARKALAIAKELQGDSAEALHAEAFVAFIERRWEAMESTWRKALELQPDNVLALGSFAISLCARGKLVEALPLFARARQADPLASFPYTLAAWGLLMSGRREEGLRYAEDALTFEKEDASAIAASAIARVSVGQLERGIAAAEQGVEVTHRAPLFVGILGWALAVAGRVEEARAILGELRARPAGSPTAVSEAWLLGALGDVDAAFDVLARAEEEYQGLLSYTGLPGLDPLRSDPRFKALLRRLDLPEE